MNIEELLHTRLDYCLMKQKSKKYRSSFYNSKVKQYSFLLDVYKKGDYEENLETAEMKVAFLPEMYENAFYNHQYEFEVLGKKPEDIEELESIEHDIQKNKALVKAYNFLLQLEDFYEASQYDLLTAMKWDYFCNCGKI